VYSNQKIGGTSHANRDAKHYPLENLYAFLDNKSKSAVDTHFIFLQFIQPSSYLQIFQCIELSLIYLPSQKSFNQSTYQYSRLPTHQFWGSFPPSPERITNTPHLNVLYPTLYLLVWYFLDVETVQTSAWDRQEIPVERIRNRQILRAKNGSGKKGRRS